MRYNIPGDWAGEWACYTVQWPNSTLWTALLHGALSDFKRGRVWDEKSGTITDAQAVGLEIWLRNTPLVLCENCADNPPPQTETVYLSDGNSGDHEMGQVVTEIKVVDGELRVYYGHCCYDVVDLSAVTRTGGSPQDLGDDPLQPGDDPITEYSSCGKAWAIVETLYGVAQSVWDEQDNPFYQWIGHIKGDWPGLELTDLDLIHAIFWAQDLKALETIANNVGFEMEPYDLLFDVTTKQAVLCYLAGQIESNATGISRHEYDQIRDAFNSEFGFNIVAGQFWNAIRDAVGYGDLNNLAKANAIDDSRDCGCPEKPFAVFPNFGTGFEWSHVIDLRRSLPDRITLLGDNPNWTLGKGVWGDPGVVDDSTNITVRLALDTVNAGAVLKKIGVVFETRGDENWSGDTSIGIGTHELMNNVDIEAACGNNPSQAGVWQLTKAVDQAIGALETECNFTLFAYHPPDTSPDPDINLSVVAISIAIAGTGTDPFA